VRATRVARIAGRSSSENGGTTFNHAAASRTHAEAVDQRSEHPATTSDTERQAHRLRNSILSAAALLAVLLLVVLALAGIGLTVGLGGSRGGAVDGLPPTAVALATLLFILLLSRLTSHAAIEQRHGSLSRSLRRTAAWVGDTQAILRKPDWRQLGSVSYVVLDIAALWACLRAVGITAPVLALVVGYQLGYLANILPVPGGVGVLDGGLVGALLLYGLPAGQTAAAVLLYHAIALLVPTPGGAVAFARLRRAITTRQKPRVLPAGPALVLRSSAPVETLSVSPT
jgi:uncharacterized membrane protein YbhN (UPF0104 family)